MITADRNDNYKGYYERMECEPYSISDDESSESESEETSQRQSVTSKVERYMMECDYAEKQQEEDRQEEEEDRQAPLTSRVVVVKKDNARTSEIKDEEKQDPKNKDDISEVYKIRLQVLMQKYCNEFPKSKLKDKQIDSVDKKSLLQVIETMQQETARFTQTVLPYTAALLRQLDNLKKTSQTTNLRDSQ